jgi:rSAM/selenodomain-associated transferase 2
MQISVIIPIFNEVDNILKIYNYLNNNSSKNNIREILFIDGGSTDGSIDLLKSNNITFLSSNKGRAVQMNFGASKASSEILYFLHVDSFPPKDFDQLIINQIVVNNYAGCFKMKFDYDHWFLNFFGWLTKFNFKICRGGDQSLFITKLLFNELNGYNENKIIYEDNDLIYRLYQKTKFTVIKQNIITSARKYKINGVYRLQFHFFIIHLMSFLKCSNHLIENYYKKNIK